VRVGQLSPGMLLKDDFPLFTSFTKLVPFAAL